MRGISNLVDETCDARGWIHSRRRCFLVQFGKAVSVDVQFLEGEFESPGFVLLGHMALAVVVACVLCYGLATGS